MKKDGPGSPTLGGTPSTEKIRDEKARHIRRKEKQADEAHGQRHKPPQEKERAGQQQRPARQRQERRRTS